MKNQKTNNQPKVVNKNDNKKEKPKTKSKLTIYVTIAIILLVCLITVLTVVLIPKTKYGKWNVTTKPTQNDVGVISRVVKNGKDEKIETKELPKLTDERYVVATQNPTCEVDGKNTYKIVLDKIEISFEVKIDKLGHDWNNPTYSWTDDYLFCYAKRICKRDNTHIEEISATQIEMVEKEPTFEADGEITYTATFDKPWAVEQIVKIVGDGKIVLTYHKKVEPTVNTFGTKEYWEGSNGKFYEDETHQIEISNIEEWKVIDKIAVTKVDEVEAEFGKDGNILYYKDANGNNYIKDERGVYQKVENEKDLVKEELEGTITLYVNKSKTAIKISHKKADVVDLYKYISGKKGVDYKDVVMYNDNTYQESSKENNFDEYIKAQKDKTLYVLKQYDVTFDTQGGTLDPSASTKATVTYGVNYGALPQIQKTGYFFDGWAIDTQGSTIVKDNQEYLLDSSCTLYAHFYEEGIRFDEFDNSITISSINPTGEDDTEKTIPSYINGKIVDTIGEASCCSETMKIYLPDTIKRIEEQNFFLETGFESSKTGTPFMNIPKNIEYIGNYAYINPLCNIVDIVLPKTLKGIGGAAFNKNIIKSITIDKENKTLKLINDCVVDTTTNTLLFGYKDCKIDSRITSFGDFAFASADKITTIDIPNKVTSLGKEAFNGCINLTNVVLPTNLTVLPIATFANCSALTSIIVPERVKEIQAQAFLYCSSLETATLPKNLETLGIIAFKECLKLKEITIPNKITELQGSMFENCSALEKVVLSNSLTTLHEKVFAGCKLLTEIKIPEGVTSLGTGVFTGCSKLNTVYLPSTLTEIKSLCFYMTNKINNVYYNGTKEDWEKVNKAIDYSESSSCEKSLRFTAPQSELLYEEIPGGIRLTRYNGTNNIVMIPDKINNKPILNIGRDCFNLKTVDELHLPKYLEMIEENAFCDFRVSKLFMQDNLKVVKESRNFFEELNQIEFSKNLEVFNLNLDRSPWYQNQSINEDIYIGKIFYKHNCPETNVVVKEGTKTIGLNAFSGEILTSIKLPTSLTRIEKSAFGYVRLKELTIPKNVEYIDKTILNNADIDNLYVDKENKKFYSKYNCLIEKSNQKLLLVANNAEIPYGVKEIGENVFANKSITTIVIPNTVEILGNTTFMDCNNLATVCIPNSIKNIQNAFASCPNLTNILYMGSQQEWNSIKKGENWDYAFSGKCKINFEIDLQKLQFTEMADSVRIDNCDIVATDYIIIPRTINGKPVTEIKTNAINNLSANIYLSDNIKIIPKLGTDITMLNIPQFVESIGVGLGNTIQAPNGVLRLPKTLKHLGLFKNKYNIKKIEIDKENTFLKVDGNCLIENNKLIFGIGNCTIPSYITEIGPYAFSNLNSLKEVCIPDSVTIIGEDAFNSCINLTSVVLPKNIKTIPSRMFIGCSSLKNVNIPNGVTEIGSSAFNSCKNLETIIIPDSATSILNQAFYSCEKLKNITLSLNIEKIGVDTFSNCSMLEKIEIPASLSEIGNYCFSNCSNLREIRYNGTQSAWDNLINGKDCLLNTSPDLRVICIGDASDFTVEDVNGGVKITNYIGNGSGVIIPDTINGKKVVDVTLRETNLKFVKLPQYLTQLNRDSICFNLQLDTLVMQNNVTRIEDFAIDLCNKLTDITFSNNLVYVGSGAFGTTPFVENLQETKYIGNILYKYVQKNSSSTIIETNYDIKPNTKYISSFAFDEFGYNLQTITIPDSVTTIYDHAFSGCSSLISIKLPKDLKVLNSNVFDYCSNLSEIILNSGLSTIKKEAFTYLPALKTLVIPESVTTIEDYIFRDVLNLETLTTPKITTNKGNKFGSLFYSKTSTDSNKEPNFVRDDEFDGKNYIKYQIPDSLTTINLTNITTINESAFYNCANIKTVTLPDCLERINKNAFYFCNNLVNINYTKNCKVNYIGQDALSASWIFELTEKYTYIGSVLIKYKDISGNNNNGLGVDINIEPFVTEIYQDAFIDIKINTLTLPDSLKYIGIDAFNNTSTKIINYSENINLEYVGYYAFSSTKWFEESNTTLKIGKVLIKYLSQDSETSFTTPNDIVMVYRDFDANMNITKIHITENVKEIELRANFRVKELVVDSSSFAKDTKNNFRSNGVTKIFIKNTISEIGSNILDVFREEPVSTLEGYREFTKID